MSTLTTELPTESIATVAESPAEEISAVVAPVGGPGPATGTEYLLEGSYKKLSRGLKGRLFRKPSPDEVAALAQAIHRSKPHTDEAAADTVIRRAKTISRFVESGVQVLVDDRRYAITLRREGAATVMVIGDLAI